jgi:hypothetical protein
LSTSTRVGRATSTSTPTASSTGARRALFSTLAARHTCMVLSSLARCNNPEISRKQKSQLQIFF